jgi:hypothetical protein
MYKTGRGLTLSILAILWLAAACKKDDKTTTAPCYWHINDKNHNGELATRITANGLQSKESATELLTVYFPAYPTATKSYKIVNYAKLGSLANDECIVQIDHNAGQLLISTGYDNVKAGIEVAANGKLTVSIPKTWARLYVSGFPQDDSSIVDGFMTEK